MRDRNTYIPVSVITVALLLTANAYGQYCIGRTTYSPRDAKGKPISGRKINKLKVIAIDGAIRAITRKESSRYSFFYQTHNSNRSQVLNFKRKLVFSFGYCNQIRDITIKYKNKTMKLIFDIGILNSNLKISAIPFQSGTFRLTSIKCMNGKGLPLVDNENQSACNVSSKNWKRISPLILESPEPCCKSRPKFGHKY